MENTIIKTEGLTKIYDNKKRVNNLDLEIKRGQIYGFLGPNGAGKSTTMKMLLGLVRPDSGTITIFDKEFSDRSRTEILKRTGAIIESPSYYGHLTGWENMKIIQNLLGIPEAFCHKALKTVRLYEDKDRKVKDYSLGMKQRLAIAMALARNPELLILDEPTNGLDPAGTQEIRELLLEMAHEHGITIMVSSHLLSEIEKIADHVGIINDGKMIFQGSIEELSKLTQSETKIETSDNQKALTLLKNSGAVLSGDSLLVKVSTPAVRAQINKILVEQGIDVYTLSVQKTSLESLFLDLTRDSKIL